MARFSKPLLVLACLFLLSQVLWLPCGCFGAGKVQVALQPDWVVWSSAEIELLEGSQDRIHMYRQGDARVIVVDSQGKPLRNLTVLVEMLKHDFLFGAGLFRLGGTNSGALDQAYCEAFVRLFNYATLPFFWSEYEPSIGAYREADLKSLASWAKEQGLTICGHPLIWAESVPSWAPSEVGQLEPILQKRVTAAISSFRGLVDLWDVVNEPTLAQRYENPVGQWMKARTPAAATTMALNWARSVGTGSALIVNDFRTDDAYYFLLKEVQKQGGKFDVVGIQTHMHRGGYPLDQVWAICERYKELGATIHFTEVTVLSGDLKLDSDWRSFHPGWETTEDGENVQAAYTEALYRLLFSHPAVGAITWWDFSDLGAWQGAPAGLLRKDMTPKPAYNRLMKLIHEEWWTRQEIKTNLLGQADFRGYYGQYRLTALVEGKQVEKIVYLKPGERNVFRIQIAE